MRNALIVAALVLALSFSGCLGLFKKDKDEDAGPTTVSSNLGAEEVDLIEETASGQYRNWTFGGQELLPTKVLWVNSTVSNSGAPGIEDRNDRSGNDYNAKIVAQDLSTIAAPYQPVELRVKLWYFGTAGSSADIDLYLDVPGTKTSYAPNNDDEFNWKVSVEELTVDTVVLPGRPFQVGVQVSNERAANPMQYNLQVEASFEEGVIAPKVPYAVQVPEGAKGITLGSAKAGGDEHVRGSVLVIGPDDELVEFVPYNDIGLAAEQKLVPITKPGEYILYALNLTGGFIRPGLDIPVPPELRPARVLDVVEQAAIDLAAPAAGVPERDYGLGAPIPGTAGTDTSFTIEGTFPLEVIATIGHDDAQEVRGATQVQISSPKGLVYQLTRMLQYHDERGNLGHSRDELNTVIQYENLDKGAYTMHIVNDGPNTEVGHVVITYTR